MKNNNFNTQGMIGNGSGVQHSNLNGGINGPYSSNNNMHMRPPQAQVQTSRPGGIMMQRPQQQISGGAPQHYGQRQIEGGAQNYQGASSFNNGGKIAPPPSRIVQATPTGFVSGQHQPSYPMRQVGSVQVGGGVESSPIHQRP
jgi:hypothetical protein